jgi:hypothetical protein
VAAPDPIRAPDKLTPQAPLTGGVRTSRVAESVRQQFAGYKNAPKIEVVDRPADIADTRQRLTALDSEEDGGSTEGMYDPRTNTVHLFADKLQNPSRARWVAYHEIVGHYGIRGLLDASGKGAGSFKRTLAAARTNPTIDSLAQAIATDRALDTDNVIALDLATEEALAELAAADSTGDWDALAERYSVSVPKRMRPGVVGAIARFIESVKRLFAVIDPNVKFSDADWRKLVEGARRYVRSGRQRNSSEGSPLSSVAPDQLSTPAFRRWFGESKVVDADGKPLVVYHGTGSEFSSFESGDGGIHFGTTIAANARINDMTAEGVIGGAPKVIPAYLNMRNPVRLPDMGNNWAPHIEAMKKHGYDGIVYENAWESPGHDSYIVFRPEQIKSATGNSGAFDPSDPSILKSTAPKPPPAVKAEAKRDEAAKVLPQKRGTAGWDFDAKEWQGRKGQLRRARAKLQDKMIVWRDVQGQIARQIGEAIPDVQNVYRIENLMHGRVSETLDRLEAEQIVPLLEAMRAAKVKPEELENYLYARHAKERNEQIAKINPKMPDGGSGMTTKEATDILAKASPSLEPLAKRVDAITQANRARLYKHGLITREAFDAMGDQYKFYVPLRGKRVEETDFTGGGDGAGRGLDTRRQPIKEALGRGAGNRAENILGEIIGDAQRGVILAEKARVGRAVMRIVLAHPNPKLWEIEPAQTERKLDAAGEVYEAVVNDWSDPSIIAVKLNGVLYKVQINNQPLAQALNHVGIDQLGAVTRFAGQINRYFSAVLTKYNPAFVPVNATRDVIFGLSGLAAEHGEGAALDAAVHYPQAARAAFRQARGKRGSSDWDVWANEFAEAGGKTGYVNMPSVEDLSRKIGKGSLTSYSPDGLAKAARAVVDAVGAVNDAVENSLRLSAYVTLRKRGSSVDAAAEYAKNLTVNFNRKGSDGSKLNAWFLFYNAAMQGAKRTTELLRRPRTYAYLGALAGAQAVATMAAMGFEDDDGEPLWNKIPDHVKRRNLVIVTPDGGVLTIPMPYGFNLFTYLSGRTVSAVMDQQGRPENRAAAMTADVVSAAAESFMPVPVGDGAMGLLPTILRIPVNVQANQDDFGRRIRNESPYSKYDIPRASMGRPDTLEVFKLLATGMNRLGGGDEYTPPPLSAFDVAPEDLEYLLKEVTGGTGAFVVNVATLGQNMAGDAPVKAREIPITNRFVTAIDEEASQQAMFYDRSDRLNRSLDRVRDTYEKDPAAAQAMLDARPELSGAVFRRRKSDGAIVVSDGRPQIVAEDPESLFGRYKTAADAVAGRNDAARAAYTAAPVSLLPTAESRKRDATIRAENQARMEAQRRFNAEWTRIFESQTE